ncbi:MAG: thioesterase [Flavobacteriia bacterium]|nr:MAG: thioesterase [Flavobacteriia bacterium]
MGKTFDYLYTVKASDLDHLNHVNNVVYVQWVQDAAEKHWLTLTNEHNVSDYVWVVIRHEIDYLRQAFLGDELAIKTWVGQTEGSNSIRHVEVYKNNKIVCRAQTHWRLLSAKTFKPVHIPPEILNLFN